MRIILIVILLSFGLTACGDPQPLDPATTRWVSYADPELHIAFQYPGDYSPSTENHNAIFRQGLLSAPMVLRFVDEAEGRERGLWFGKAPTGEITLGGRTGKKYIYDHGDGPFSEITTAYVVDYQGKFLALEFRGKDTATEAAVVKSFEFSQP